MLDTAGRQDQRNRQSFRINSAVPPNRQSAGPRPCRSSPVNLHRRAGDFKPRAARFSHAVSSEQLRCRARRASGNSLNGNSRGVVSTQSTKAAWSPKKRLSGFRRATRSDRTPFDVAAGAGAGCPDAVKPAPCGRRSTAMRLAPFQDCRGRRREACVKLKAAAKIPSKSGPAHLVMLRTENPCQSRSRLRCRSRAFSVRTAAPGRARAEQYRGRIIPRSPPQTARSVDRHVPAEPRGQVGTKIQRGAAVTTESTSTSYN